MYDYLLMGMLIGGVGGYLLTRLYCQKILKEQKALQSRLKQTELAYQNHQQQVTEHFTETATLINRLTTDYQSLHQHMVDGVAALCPIEKAIEFQATAPLLERQEAHPNPEPAVKTDEDNGEDTPGTDTSDQAPPKDYPER